MEILKVENVVKSFRDIIAVNDVSLSVSAGRIFGLLGPNGAGKTTMIRMITNIYMPDSGSITLFGQPVSSELQNRIGYLPEERGLYKKLKVIDQLVYFGMLKGMTRPNATTQALKWLAEFGAADWAGKKIQELSKGMQQKVQFICTILHEPDFLILDEPFSGFDPINVEALKNIILKMRGEGKTIILSTHVMQQVEELCDDICLINKGKAILSGRVREIKKSFGRDSVIMEFEGSNEFLNAFPDIEFINKSANRVEFKLNGMSSSDVLKAASESVEVIRFELAEPNFNEIFIDVVGTQEAENE